MTVCDNVKQRCPTFPGKFEEMYWGLDNPTEVEGTDEEIMRAFRKTRDMIKQNIRDFIVSR